MSQQLHTEQAVSNSQTTCDEPDCHRTQIHALGKCKSCYQRAWISAKRRSQIKQSTRVSRDVRAENIRKWLAFGHQTLDELAKAMGCSRFALHHTLSTMPDIETATVKIVRLTKRPASAQRFA